MDNFGNQNNKTASLWEKIVFYSDYVFVSIFLIGNLYYLKTYYQFDISVILVFIFGLLFYGSVIEYWFHRHLFHGKIEKIYQIHLMHHEDPKSYVSPPIYFSISIGFLLLFISITFLGHKLGCSFVAGITLGSLFYQILHPAIHRIGYTNSKIFNYFVAHHHFHHQHPEHHFRVTQPFWDQIFKGKNAKLKK